MLKTTLRRVIGFALAAVMLFAAIGPAAAVGQTTGAASAYLHGGITQTTLPEQGWQDVVSFPDWDGYVDDTLAMNSLFSFTTFSGQGELYVTVAAGVQSFRMFVNNVEMDTGAMPAGGTYRIDISDITLDGTNTIQVTNIAPATLAEAVTVSIPYPTVISGNLADVGMDQDIVDLIGDYISAETKYGFSGAELAVIKEGRLVVNEAWGAANGYRPDGTRILPGDADYVPVTTDTLYDLASNTKMYSVNYALQYLYDQDKVDLDAKITSFFPEFAQEGKTIFKAGTTEKQKAQILAWKAELTVRDILMHQAGFDPDPQYHNDQFNQVTQKPQQGVANPLFSQDRDTTRAMVLASPLTYEPGRKTVYSDVDYMLLCFIIEQITGKRLDAFLKETFWDPMGLTHVTYNPLENGFTKNDCAATELQGNTRDGIISFKNVRTATVQGEVHDEKAYYAMGGISGHAGMFSNAEDLAKLASVMLTGGYGEHRFFSKNTIDEFTKAKSLAYPTWGLGWWRQGEIGRYGYFTTHASGSTIGHQGWTGTLTVIDPENDLVIVLLTNKKNSPVLDNTIDANDFYSDNMVLGGLGSVIGYVYESFTSTPDAMDASVMQFAKERIKLLAYHKNAYDEAPHMNDAFALTDLVVTRAEKRCSQVTLDYARNTLDDLKTYVSNYVVKEANLANAATWTNELQARIDAIVPGSSAPAAPSLVAKPVDSMPSISAGEAFVSGQDQNAVYFPSWASKSSTSLCYNNSTTWFEGFAGQGTVYFLVCKPISSMRIFVNGVEVDASAMLNTHGRFAIDVSSITVNGRNSVQVTDMPISTARFSLLMVVTNPEVGEGTLEQVGIDEKAINMIDSIIQKDIDYGFTSAQMAIVKDGKMVYSNAWGTVNAYNTDGTPKTDSPAVTTDTLYDLASNTKMYATNYAVQYLVQQKKLSLDAKITNFFPTFVDDTIEIHYQIRQGNGAPDLATAKAWKAELTVADILQHQAGFAPDPQFHNDQFDQVTQTPTAGVDNVLYAIGKDAVAKAICKSPLVYQPGTKTVYSDVDYMLLGLIVEQVTGQDLDTFMKEIFYNPLGLTHITYNPLDNGFTADQIAATELNGNSRDGVISFKDIRTGTIQGTVHDEKAYYAMGGVSGHAGLFSNAEDLAKLASMMLNQSGYADHRLFDYNTNHYFTARKDSSATWGQGWWRQGDCGRPWYFGVQASRNTVGHQGWTGTLTVIDPADDLVIVYLTNKINSPVTDNKTSPNQFDGNWYTASTLGFVANILYQGLSNHDASTDIQPALDALLSDMLTDKLRLVADEGDVNADHPIVKSAYALAEGIFDMAEARPTDENAAAAQLVLDSLDADRDADMIAKLTGRMPILLEELVEKANAAAKAAQEAAEQAQTDYEKVQAIAEEIIKNAGSDTEFADKAAKEVEAAKEALENAKKAAEDALKAAQQTQAAVAANDKAVAIANAAAAEYARQAAEAYAQMVAMRVDMATYLADAQEAARREAEAKAAEEAAKLAQAKYEALAELIAYAQTLTYSANHEAAMEAAMARAKAMIESAETIDEVPALLEAAKNELALATDCACEAFADLNPDSWYHDAVDYTVSHGLFKGVDGTRFAPKATMTRGMLVTVLYRFAGEPEVDADAAFEDVAPNHYYSKAVAWAQANGLVKGIDAKHFAPNVPVTRQQLVAIFYRYAALMGYGTSASADLSAFTDAGSVQAYAREAMAWAVGIGLVNGRSATRLEPSGLATRAEAAAIFTRFVENVIL